MELAKTISDLNRRKWYRHLRIAFLLSFVLAETAGVLLVASRTKGTVIAPISLRLIGRTLKEDIPAYRGMSDEQAGREVFRRAPDLWTEYVEKYKNRYAIDPVAQYPEYSKIQRMQFCAIIFLLITVFFEVIRRAFYYVVFGRIFPRKRRRLRSGSGADFPQTP